MKWKYSLSKVFLILSVVFIREGVLGKRLQKTKVNNGSADLFNYNSMDVKDRSDYVERCDDSQDIAIENEDCIAIQNIENDNRLTANKQVASQKNKTVKDRPVKSQEKNAIFCSTGERPKPKSFFKLLKEATNKYCCEDIVDTPLPETCCQPVVTDDSSIFQFLKTTTEKT